MGRQRVKLYRRSRSPHWYVYVGERSGKQIRVSTRTTDKAEARRVGEALVREFHLRGLGLLDTLRAARRPVTLSQAVEELLAALRVRQCRESTIDSAKRALGRAVKVLGASTTVDTITRAMLETYQARRLEAGAAASTINLETQKLAALYRVQIERAAERGIELRNPTIGLRSLKARRHTRLVTPEEAERLIAAAGNQVLADAILLAIRTGMRRGEIESLRWADVDLESPMIHVRASDQWKPKTSASERSFVPVPDAVAMLRRRFADRGLVSPYVFGVSRTRPRIGTRFEVVRRRAGMVGAKSLRFHDLRGTFVTWGILSGIPPQMLAKMCGWTETSKMLDLYSREDRQRLSEMLASRMPALALPAQSLHTTTSRGKATVAEIRRK